MSIDSSKLTEGQMLKVETKLLEDRLPDKLVKQLTINPFGKLVGYKMVDANQFGLVLKLEIGETHWFFESELSLPLDKI